MLAAWDRRDRLSAISAITLSPVRSRPNLDFELYPHSIKGPQVVDFLADLHRRLGPLTVVRSWLADHPGVVTEKLPAYAPTLNPDEGVWGWAKYGRLSNLAASDTEELWDGVVEELVTVKHSPKLLNGFIRQTELPEISLSG